MKYSCYYIIHLGCFMSFTMHFHHRNQVLCRLPWQTAKARMANDKGLCRLPRTAKGSGKVGYGKELLCRLLSEADGKGAFAISGGRQRKPTAINSLLVR